MELNKEQQSAVYCEKNAVVSAGAGSGKTMVLANRFVWLLTEKGYKIDEILTLTFTKKAAAQMYKRIYSLITEIAENETGIKAQRAQDALRDFIKARIQTLDSYSASIVKQCAVRYGLSPDFQIDQDRCQKLALQVSYPFLITHRNHPAIEKLYVNSRPNDIVHNIFADILFNYSLLGKPIDWNSDLKKQFEIICAEWDKSISAITALLSKIEADALNDETLLPDIIPVISKYSSLKSNIPKTDEIRNYLDKTFAGNTEDHPVLKNIMLLVYFLMEINSIDLRKGKRKDNPVKENVKQAREDAGAILSLAVSITQADISVSLIPLLTELQTQYLQQKRTEGILTFSDVAYLARTILLEHTSIRQSEKESFKAIMIDEFQDNNDLQKELLFLLAEKLERCEGSIPAPDNLCPDKLFFVGDEKQSIYLFRGADVSVFRRLNDEISSSQLPLKTNYRSSPELIEAFNKIMPSVFVSNKELPLYEASYTPLQAHNTFDGNLTLCIYNSTVEDDDNEEDFLSDNENEAHFIAKKIRTLLDEKKYEPKDIALLFRTRSGQALYEKHLRLLDIPYSSEDVGNLFYGGPVNDIMSVIRLIAHPLDSASYAEMLRSPFAGLTLSGTALCLSFFQNDEQPSPFDDKPLESLSKTDKEKYLNGKKVYRSILKKSETLNVSGLIYELWYNEGYYYETEWNPQVSVYRELFDYLYHLAVINDSNNQGLAAFTDLIQSYRDEGKQLTDIDIPLEHSGAGCVHLMTIHKSKGLEFPVVFLCGCGKRSRSDSCDSVFYSEDTGVALSLPVPEIYRSIPNTQNNFFWQLGKEEARQKATAELRRVLYVGMTRAEKELYITGSLKIKKNDDEETEREDFYSAIKNHISLACEERWKEQPNAIEGDIILDNDTLFGLLLPAITMHEPGGFYALEEIPKYSENQIRYKGDQYNLNEYIQNTENKFKKAKVIKTPVVPKNHKSPVSLKSEEDSLSARDCSISKVYSGVNSLDIFSKVDSLLLKLTKKNDEDSEKFNSGSFGTVAHICVEAHFNENEPVIPANITASLPPNDLDTLLKAGKEIASRFINSPLGTVAKNSLYRQSEFPFRSILKNNGNEVFINGTIDLFFEEGNSIHIVDFKTDAQENPAGHTAQMACYYKAVSELFAQKECYIWLYYLRTGHAVEMTEKVKKFNLVQRAFL